MGGPRIIEQRIDGMDMREHREETLRWVGRGEVEIRVGLRDIEGNLIGKEDVFTKKDLLNSVSDQGVNSLFAVYFAGTGVGYNSQSSTKSPNWYMGLTTSGPNQSSILSNINEINAVANPCQSALRRPIVWDFSVNRHVRSGSCIWTASGAWTTGATHLFITDAASGTSGIFFNYFGLSAVRQPAADGDTITVSWDGSL